MNNAHNPRVQERSLLSVLTSKEPWRSYALLLLRGYVGAAVLLAHGIPKLAQLTCGDHHFVELVASLGFPAPTLFAWLATVAQVAGSAALIAGAATRLAALGVASTIAVGVVGVHLGEGFKALELGFAYVVMMVTVALLGAGDLSLDRLVRDRRTMPASAGVARQVAS